jgi:hypothetical protein
MHGATDSSDRIRDAVVYATRETAPMLVGLAIVAAALLAVISLGTPAPPASAPATPGPYDGFTFEQVGVGVRWLVDDGAGNRPRDDAIAFEPDGSVITCCDYPGFLFGDTEHYEMARLGDSQPAARWDKAQLNLMGRAASIAIGPDSTLWVAGQVLASLREGEWTQHYGRGSTRVMEVASDGTVWAGIENDAVTIVRISDGRERAYKVGRGLPRVVSSWGSEVTGIATTSDGRTWVGMSAAGTKRPGGLLRFDGQRWNVVRPLGRGVDTWVEGVAKGPDGALWVYLNRKTGEDDSRGRGSSHLARFDEEGWTVFDDEDGVPQRYPRRAKDIDPATLMRAGPDGTVWLTQRTGSDCHGLWSFDATGSRSHLPEDACVKGLRLAPDGTAWVSIAWLYDDAEQAHWSDGLYRYRAGLYLVEPPGR